MTACRFFSVKMFKLLHQCNNIVDTTQLSSLMIRCQNFNVTVNVQSLPLQPQAPTQASSRLILEVFYNLAQITWSASLSSAIFFGFVLSLQ